MPNRHVRGDRSFNRLLKQLPDDVTTDIRDQLKRTGQMLLDRARSRAPVYQGRPRKGVIPGALQGGLSYSVPPVRLSLKVGLVGKPINRKLFYGRLVEFGHRIGYSGHRLQKAEPINGKTVRSQLERARRRRDLRVNGVAPRPFLYTVTRQEIYEPFRDMWVRALRRVAAGASDD